MEFSRGQRNPEPDLFPPLQRAAQVPYTCSNTPLRVFHPPVRSNDTEGTKLELDLALPVVLLRGFMDDRLRQIGPTSYIEENTSLPAGRILFVAGHRGNDGSGAIVPETRIGPDGCTTRLMCIDPGDPRPARLSYFSQSVEIIPLRELVELCFEATSIQVVQRDLAFDYFHKGLPIGQSEALDNLLCAYRKQVSTHRNLHPSSA